MTQIKFQVEPGGKLTGQTRVASDKSISHRALMLASIAEGITSITGFLEGADTLASVTALRSLGVCIEALDGGYIKIIGVGRDGLNSPAKPLDLGNSGTSMRMLCGLLAGQPFDSELVGDPSLSTRPMNRIIAPLAKMGAHITPSENGTAPLRISGGHPLQGIDYQMPVASAQVKSCLLLAGIFAQGKTCITEPVPTRDHTERMLVGFGYKLDRQGNNICIRGGGRLKATEIDIPGDISSAAFFVVGAVISEDAEIVLEHVGINPTRTGVIEILRLMGADIEVMNRRTVGGEPVADLVIRSSALKGIEIPRALISLAIDEFPAIFIAAACAVGETRLYGAEELRVKESDRIQVMADGLNASGICATALDDGMIIQGGKFSGGSIESHGDHRIAMAFTMAGLRTEGLIQINDCKNVDTSFPNFVETCRRLGLNITVNRSP